MSDKSIKKEALQTEETEEKLDLETIPEDVLQEAKEAVLEDIIKLFEKLGK